MSSAGQFAALLHHERRGAWLAWPGILAELVKLPVILAVTLTSAAGFLLASGRFTADLPLCLAGTLLVAAAAAAMNEIQEAGIDARMPRTASRPLPAGRLGHRGALAISVLLAGVGLALLASLSTRPLAAVGLAAAALAWYNLVYTPLKRVTAWAAIPGAVIGALPPLIGWVGGGGSLADPRGWLVAALFFLWQVPHFWLILLAHGDEYARAGLPSLTTRMPLSRLSRMTFVWIVAVTAAAPLLSLLVARGPAAAALLGAASLGLAGGSLPLAAGRSDPPLLRRSRCLIDAFALVLAATLGLASIVR